MFEEPFGNVAHVLSLTLFSLGLLAATPLFALVFGVNEDCSEDRK